MSAHSGLLPDAAASLAWAGVGALLGRVYFAALRRTVERIRAGGSRLAPVALTLGRLALAVLVLWAAARSGAVPALATLGGFLLVRTAVLRRARGSAP